MAKQAAKQTPGESESANDMRRWSEAKLDRERAFAEACVVESWPETIAWRDAIRNEVRRRSGQDAQ
jgi:hypothetical protein